jgi:aldose 1-epimerase
VHADHDPFPAQVGWHPWFARPVELTFSATAKYRRDGDGIPDGTLVDPGPRPWDDCFTGVDAPPELRWDDGLVVTVRSDCDHWVVYDEPAHALCVEPQSGPPDGLTLAPALVEPGRPLVRTMTWTWGTDGGDDR